MIELESKAETIRRWRERFEWPLFPLWIISILLFVGSYALSVDGAELFYGPLLVLMAVCFIVASVLDNKFRRLRQEIETRQRACEEPVLSDIKKEVQDTCDSEAQESGDLQGEIGHPSKGNLSERIGTALFLWVIVLALAGWGIATREPISGWGIVFVSVWM